MKKLLLIVAFINAINLFAETADSKELYNVSETNNSCENNSSDLDLFIDVSNFNNQIEVAFGSGEYQDLTLTIYCHNSYYPTVVHKKNVHSHDGWVIYTIDTETWEQGKYSATLKSENSSYTETFELAHTGRQPKIESEIYESDLEVNYKLAYGITSGEIKIFKSSEFGTKGLSATTYGTVTISGQHYGTYTFQTGRFSQGEYAIVLLQDGRIVATNSFYIGIKSEIKVEKNERDRYLYIDFTAQKTTKEAELEVTFPGGETETSYFDLEINNCGNKSYRYKYWDEGYCRIVLKEDGNKTASYAVNIEQPGYITWGILCNGRLHLNHYINKNAKNPKLYVYDGRSRFIKSFTIEEGSSFTIPDYTFDTEYIIVQLVVNGRTIDEAQIRESSRPINKTTDSKGAYKNIVIKP